MFTLTFTEVSGKHASHPLVEEEAGLVVGRDATCDVVLASKEVSRRHARFYVRAGELMVEDLESHNGVYVAGARIGGPTALTGTLAIEVGDVRVTVGATGSRTVPTQAALPKRSSAASPKAGAGSGGAGSGGAGSGGAGAGGAGAGGASRAPGAAGVGAGAALRGLGRDAAVEIRLPPRATVGRDQACDVVLDDDSVSRKHAELFRDERGQYRIKDLESANGTFIDGKKIIVATVLPDGAKVRFGDVELLFWRPPLARQPLRQRALLGALVLLVLTFGALYLVRRPKITGGEGEPSPADQSAALAEQGQAALEGDRFDEAARLAQEALEEDPLAQAPRKLLANARREQQSSKIFAQALSRAQVSKEDEALRLLAQVSTDSRFYPRARIKAKELGTDLVRTHSSVCRSIASSDRAAQIAEECARALDVKCQQADVDQDGMLKALRAAEKKLQRKVPWSCPPELAALFRDEAQGSAQSGLDEGPLKPLYPDPAVRGAMLKYARGDTGEALRMLQLLQRPPKTAQQARELGEKMRIVDGRFREGQTALIANDLPRADQFWTEALQADAQLMPANAESFSGRQMRGTLAQEHGKLGDERFAKTQYASAYDEWMKGLAVSPKDPHLLDSLARLEKVAEGLLASGNCDQIAIASHVTRADPPSAAHTAAQKALDGCK